MPEEEINNQEPTAIIANSSSEKRKKIIIATLVCLGLIILIITLDFLKVISIPFLNKPSAPAQPSKHVTPSAVIPSNPSLTTCAVKKEGNPIVQDVQKLTISQKEIIVGTFKGNINKLNLNSDQITGIIELISPQGEQVQEFEVKEEKGLVSDSTTLKDLTLKDLKLGQTVVISFNCFPEKGNEFRLTQIAVTSK